MLTVEPPLLDETGRVTAPLLVVDLDDPQAEVPLRDERLLVGCATRPLGVDRRKAAAMLDVTFVQAEGVSRPEFVSVPDPLGAARQLRDTAAANPQAALVLGHVLRAAPADVSVALDLESFAYSTLLGGAEFARWLAWRGPRQLPSSPPAPPVLVHRADDTLHVTLNRPERRNAYGREVRDGLVEALRLALFDSALTRVVLDGTGPSFSSGGDLDEFGTTPDIATAHFIRTRGGAGRLVHRLADRVEARLHGACVGAGIEVPAFAGHVVARQGTTFRLPEVGMGLIPGAGGTVSIARRIGRWRTFYLALSGRPLPTGTALDWGLIDVIE
ncbi:MAG TPA: enoyl-CoA hydratase/isomerase family protein [Amycolatopsis sp.]|uniref:enoyl-CoA hydratase/isomerase family protein n=1 Tax=Amycolatopsis sp. TaxID=37632 RepID=UPI002B485CDD|nr:enoyl-CoA hydratase/isomerase family protein [Amycolatopsis sp.]HKS47031.1 enoyl-CoA hydratase/isomerase family protein [Amycolatopsis sp.]